MEDYLDTPEAKRFRAEAERLLQECEILQNLLERLNNKRNGQIEQLREKLCRAAARFRLEHDFSGALN